MAADVAEFLRKKFLTDFEEAKESTELSPGNPLLPHLENAKQAVEEISTIYITSSSATLVRLQPPLYLVNNVLAECRIFELQWNDPTKSLVRFNFFTKLYFNFRMRSQLGTAQKTLESIINLEKHNPSIQMPFATAQRYPSASVVNDSEIFGFDGHAQCIENLLLGDKTSDGFIAAGVVGMGGTGKNTLVGKVLSSPRICNEFFPRIQVSLSAILSNGGDTRRIIGLQLLRELSYNDLDESLGSLELLEVLKKQLLGKKYLIVLNDVWHENEWYANLYSEQLEGEIFEDRLSHGLPKGSGGAVIVTSRLEHVARSMVGGKNLFRLKPSLHWRDSYKILTKHINEDQLSKDIYNMFSKIKYEVVDQCHGLPLAAEIIARFISSGGKSSHGGKGWDTVEKRFDQLSGSTNGLLPRRLFAECIGMRWGSEGFAEALFDMFARRRQDISGDWISKDQLQEFWEQYSDHSFGNSLQIIFDIMDKDGDGKVNRDEVREIIILCASANKLSRVQKQAEEYAALIMEELDPDNHGYITIDSLEMLQSQALSESPKGDNRHLNRMLSQKLMSAYDTKLWYLMLDNWQKVWVTALWIGVMSGLFGYKYFQYRQKDAAYQVMGSCMCIAKGAAETLKLNMALVLLPICRNTLTWLRNKTKLGCVIPFVDNIDFHVVIAIGIAIGVGIHGVVHLACIFPRLLHASSDNYELMKPFFRKGQPRSYWHFVKSVEGVTGITMVVLMAIAFTLATPWFRRGILRLPRPLRKVTGFNAFWYSHHLFVIVYVLLLVHGIYLYLTHEWYKKTTWMYLAVPLILYGSERLIRALRSSIQTVSIFKVVVYPGNVLALHISKPQGFRYKSGQYMLIKCTAVSPFEWHPFYMTSSPGDDYLSFHIRILGDWTRQLKTVFSQVCMPPPDGKSALLRADCLLGEINPEIPKILIDGPFGAPTQDYKNYEVVLLLGLGIGVAPCISIMKDIVNNMKAMEEEENALEIESGVATPNMKIKTVDFKTRRAYLYWVAREEGSFDWFKNVMDEVAELDHKGVIEMHIYCTSVYEEGDVRSAFIAMLQSINHAKNGLDVVSGTRVKSHFGKPNWRRVYKKIAVSHPNSRVGVFYCGASVLAKELSHLASVFSHKTTTKFDFHKENFV